MTVQNLWPLAFLALVPIIILLYILKQKAVDQPFSSSLLWKEIYKNLEARTPFEKFKQNILLYLQILAMLLLIFALMAPVLRRGRVTDVNVVIVMDNSASMGFSYEDGKSRLQEGIDRAKKLVDSMDEGTKITVLSCGETASLVYQGTDSYTAKNRLAALFVSEESGTLDGAAAMVNSFTKELKNVRIYCYTDTEFSAEELKRSNPDAGLFVEDLYSTGENAYVEYVSYGQREGKTEVLCRVKNAGSEVTSQDVSLYLDGRLLDVVPVTVEPGESQVVYFTPQILGEQTRGVLTAELSKKDALTEDNRQRIRITDRSEKKVLLLSAGNVFLEKALGLLENVTVMKSDDGKVLNQIKDDYDLYVFDGISLPEGMELSAFPKNAAFLFLNLNSVGTDSFLTVKDSKTDCYLYFEDTPATAYLADFSFGITACKTYELPVWGQPFLRTADGGVAGYYGNFEGRMTGVLGFDLHSTDFALKAEFPIFMSQLEEELLVPEDKGAPILNFPAAAESEVFPVTAVAGEENSAVAIGSHMIRNWVLLAALFLLVLEWIFYIRQSNSRKKRQFLVVRIALLVLVVLAMAQITLPKKQGKSETIFLVDLSDSMEIHKEELEKYLRNTIDKMPEKNEAAVVVFGKDTAVEQFLSREKLFSRFAVSPVSSATNIENAVINANAMFDEGVDKNLILITDGNENSGNMTKTAGLLAGSDVRFKAIALSDGIAANREVYVEKVTVPSVIHVGDHYNITVSIHSNVETDATLFLYSGRSLKGQQAIHVTKGKNQFVFEDTGTEGSIAQYKAVLECPEDTISANNTFVTFAEIEAPPKVLLVEGTVDEGKEFEKILTAANVECDRISPKGVPVNISELNQYKAVITLNVYYDDLRQGFADVLKTFVKDYAGGYICIGGDDSYALGAYRNTPLEEILPVYMSLEGEKEIPKMAMAMVIDQSGSMSSPVQENSSVTGLDLAKQAALAGVTELRSTDEVGVLAFDDRYHWTVPLKAAEDLEDIKAAISTIGYGGGTSIYPALEQAYEKMKKSDAKIKHIILLTDGQDGFMEYDDLLKKINEAGITVSTVAVGEDAARDILNHIAKTCNGRTYYTDLNNSIPRIFAQEVYLSTNTYLINEKFYPVISSNSEILTGVKEGFPPLWGYVGTTRKPMAEVVLKSDRGDPILAVWQYGLGKTVAWCSDGDNQWTREFAVWENTPMFWANTVHYVVSDTGLGEDSLEVEKAGNSVVIRYITGEYTKETGVSAVVTEDDGKSGELTLNPVRPGVFEGTLSADEVGIYSISLRKSEGDQVLKSYNTAYANQYSKEYQFGSGQEGFQTFVAQAGGEMISFADEVWVKKPKDGQVRFSLTVPLLILALFVWLFDIMIRRLSLDVAGFFRRGWERTWDRTTTGLRSIRMKGKKTEKSGVSETAPEIRSSDRGEMASGEKLEYKKEYKAEPVEGQEKKSAKATGKKKKSEKKEDNSQNTALDMDALLRKKKERE